MSNNPQITIGVTATDRARGVLAQVDQSIKQTTNVVSSEGQKMVSRSQQIATAFKSNMTSMAQSVAGLGAGLTSFAFSYGAIETAQLSAQTAQLTYEKSLDRLNKLQTNGKATTEQLAIAQQEVALNSAKLADAQDNVSETYTQFLAQVPSQLISFGVAGSAIMKSLGLSHAQAAAGATGQAGATNLLSAAMFRSVGAAMAARAAMIAAFIATPVGAVITGVSILIIALATNVGGLRDRVFELGTAILNFIDHHFKPLADAIRWFIDNVAKPLGAFFESVAPPAIDSTTIAIDTLNQSTVNLGQSAPVAIMSVQNAFTSLETTGVRSANNIQAAYERMKQGVVNSTAMSIFDPDFIDSVTGRSRSGGRSNGDIVSRARAAFGNIGDFVDNGGHATFVKKHAGGGIIDEPSLIMGLRTGRISSAAEVGSEQIIPHGRSGRGQTMHFHFEFDRQEFARAIARDVNTEISRIRKIEMRITHESIHGGG